MTDQTQQPIPQSNALAEASSDSLAELLNRDPEGYTKKDLALVIEGLRQQRVRWAASEAEKASRPKERAVRGPAKQLQLPVSSGDLDL